MFKFFYFSLSSCKLSTLFIFVISNFWQFTFKFIYFLMKLFLLHLNFTIKFSFLLFHSLLQLAVLLFQTVNNIFFFLYFVFQILLLSFFNNSFFLLSSIDTWHFLNLFKLLTSLFGLISCILSYFLLQYLDFLIFLLAKRLFF